MRPVPGKQDQRPQAALTAARACALAMLIGASAATAGQHLEEPILPLPQQVELDPRKVALGKKLFADRRLSRDNTLACASCHRPENAGADGRQFGRGVAGTDLPVNTPTVLNSGFNFRQFWDGRAATLEDQVEQVLHNPNEMDSRWPDLVAELAADRAYPDEFRAIYGDEIRPAHIMDAIATFERSLITPNAPIDRYLRGEEDALSEAERRGYELFKSYGCASCHQGRNVAGNMFQRFGIFGDYFAQRGGLSAADYGRYNVTGLEEDRYVFRVPSLRNVALTAPYFHDGSAATLEQAVQVMARHQLGRDLSAEDVSLLVAFLGALTGDYEGEPLWPASP